MSTDSDQASKKVGAKTKKVRKCFTTLKVYDRAARKSHYSKASHRQFDVQLVATIELHQNGHESSLYTVSYTHLRAHET